MNGEILRGEVYWVCLDDSIGGEEKTGRPAVVISSNGLNEKQNTVVVAFLTTSGFASATRPSVVSPDGTRRRVICDQIRTVDKSRLVKYDSSLEESELVRVTGALASAMSIPLPQAVKSEKKAPDDDVVYSLRCEAEMWRRMYEKTMDQLVDFRVGAAIAERTKVKPIKSGLPEPDSGFEEDPIEEESQPKPKRKREEVAWDGVKVNINTVKTATELKNRTGMSMHTATEIVRTRKVIGAYESLEDLLALEHFGEKSMLRYGHMLTVGEPEPTDEAVNDAPAEKVNVNKANIYELMGAGFGKPEAGRIVRWVKKYGEFSSLDDLTKVDGVTGKLLRKIRDKLEV